MADNKADLDGDGKVSQRELEIAVDRLENIKKMAWICLASIIGAAIAILFVLPETRVEKLGTVLDLFWIATGSVIGAFVGVGTFMSKK